MRYILQHTSIPIPKVLKIYDNGDGTQDLVMDFIQGRTLNVVWSSLTRSEKENVTKELAGYISQLRDRQPSEKGVVGSLVPGSGYNHRLGSQRFGPFQSVTEFHQFIRRADILKERAQQISVTHFHSNARSYVTKLTHRDLSLENIMIQDGKIASIVDWELCGWFPEYWEYIKIYFGYRQYRKDFSFMIDKILTTYPEELAVEGALLRRFDVSSYDTPLVKRPIEKNDEDHEEVHDCVKTKLLTVS